MSTRRLSAYPDRYVRDVLDQDRPIRMFLFDELGSNAKDIGTGAVDGTYQGTVHRVGSTPGPHLPRGCHLNGGGANRIDASATNMGNGSAQSYEMWAFFAADITASSGGSPKLWGSTQSNTSPMIFGNGTGVLTNEVVFVTNDQANAGSRTGWTGFTIPAGWHHHVLVYTGTQNAWLYYLDGLDIVASGRGSKISAASGARGFGAVGTWRFGSNSSTESCDGQLAAVAAYNFALSPSRVLQHYQAGTSGLLVPSRMAS